MFGRIRETRDARDGFSAEWQGVAARGCYDLTQHQEASGKSLEYFEERTKSRYVPHVIEPSLGVDRLFLAIIASAYHEDEVKCPTSFHYRVHTL